MTDREEGGRPGLPRTSWRFIFFIFIVVAAIVLLRSGVLDPGLSVDELQRRVTEAGWAGPILFICIFTILTNTLFPTSIVLLAAGLAFGGGLALALALPATMLAYALGYLLSASLAREMVRGVIERFGWLHILENIEQRSAFRISFAARFTPIPVGAQSYLLGLARLRFLPYLIGSTTGSLPWMFGYTQVGAAAGGRLWAGFWPGLALCLVVIVVADRWWHRSYRKHEG